MSRIHQLLVLAALTGCAPPIVDFQCQDGALLCELIEITGDPRPLAAGIDVTGVTLYQGVEIPLMQSGVGIDNDIPIVAGRDGLVRISYELAEDWSARELTARLYLYRDDILFGAFQVNDTPVGASDLGVLESTFNIDMPGTSIIPDLEFMVEIVESTDKEGPGEVSSPDWPVAGTSPFGIVEEGAELLRVFIIPIQYDADGSGRLPDTSETQIEIYRSWMYRIYPAVEVEIEVADEPLSTNASCQSSGNGWSQLLGEVGAARNSYGVDSDQYIYGLFKYAESPQAGVYGLSNVAGAQDVQQRAAIGLGYNGEVFAETMVHELGHAHGRYHVDCGGADGIDENYPYEGDTIGSRGYDLITHSLKNPETYADFMSYCDPTWASDYTYDALHTRIMSVGSSSAYYVGEKTQFSTVWAHTDGSFSWGAGFEQHGEPGGELVTIQLLNGAGRVVGTAEAYFSPFGGLPGGVYSFEDPGPEVVRIRHNGELSDIRPL